MRPRRLFQYVEEGRPNAVGVLPGDGEGYNLLFTGHMDTSYDGDEDYLVGEGFKAKAVERDGWIWGLGANNMKSGLAAALVALEAIARTGIRLRGDISFGGVVGEIEKTDIEEFQGSSYSGYGIGSKHLVTHGVTADYAILAEPTGLRISTANMGVIWVRLTVDGTVSHSVFSNRPGVINAIEVMGELQTDLKAWIAEYESRHEFMGERPNVTIAAIRGGAAWRLSRNPYECSLYLDIRTVPGQSTEAIKRELRRVLNGILRAHGRGDAGDAALCHRPADADFRRSAGGRCPRLGTAALTGERPASILRRPGADAVHFRRYDVPCAVFGPGGRTHPDSKGRLMHAVGEHVLIEDVLTAARIYLATALDCATGRRRTVCLALRRSPLQPGV